MTTSDRRESGHTDGQSWFIRVIPLCLVLGFLLGPHWSDNTLLGLIFIGVVVALFEGCSRAAELAEGQRQNTLLLEQFVNCQRESALLLEQIVEGQGRSTALLESMEKQQNRPRLERERGEAEQDRFRRRRIRETIASE
jgi:hypothetical protein